MLYQLNLISFGMVAQYRHIYRGNQNFKNTKKIILYLKFFQLSLKISLICTFISFSCWYSYSKLLHQRNSNLTEKWRQSTTYQKKNIWILYTHTNIFKHLLNVLIYCWQCTTVHKLCLKLELPQVCQVDCSHWSGCAPSLLECRDSFQSLPSPAGWQKCLHYQLCVCYRQLK